MGLDQNLKTSDTNNIIDRLVEKIDYLVKDRMIIQEVFTGFTNSLRPDNWIKVLQKLHQVVLELEMEIVYLSDR